MKKVSVLFLMAFLLLPAMANASDESYDLEVTNVEIVPCVQTENLDDDIYDVYFRGSTVPEEEVISIVYENYLDGDFEDYEMLEIADDESWFRYAEYNNNDFGTMNYKVVCLAIDFTAEGDFETLASSAGDSLPTDFDEFLDYVAQDIQMSSVLVPSTPMTENVFEPYFYQSGGGAQIYPQYLNEENRVFTNLRIYENELNPDDSFDLVTVIDNDFSESLGIFNRTFFGCVRHYNDGPVVVETDETNNVLYTEDFLDPWMEHLAAPDVEISSSDDDSFVVSWDEVDGAENYIVAHYRKHLSSLNEEWISSETQTELTYDAPLATSDNYIDCVYVMAVDDNSIFGRSSDDVCMGQLFTDVDEGLWYTEYTHNAVQNGMISGYANSNGSLTGNFGPADTITTVQALKMVAILNGRYVNPDLFSFELPYTIPSDFDSHWGHDYILSAYILDFDLTEDIDSFVERDITRAEMINLIVESMEVEVPTYSSYSFSDIEGHRYADEIELAYQLGIVSGYAGTDTFGPDNSLLRAEAVKIFVKSGNAFSLTWPGYEY